MAGRRVANSAHTLCSSWHGSIAEAKQRCIDDPSCRALHDWGGDGGSWRTCSVTVDAMAVGDGKAKTLEIRRGALNPAVARAAVIAAGGDGHNAPVAAIAAGALLLCGTVLAVMVARRRRGGPDGASPTLDSAESGLREGMLAGVARAMDDKAHFDV